jgi:hypothetical protein
MRICGGTMMAARITPNSSRRPRNSVRENAYAAVAEIATVIAVTATATTRLLSAHTGSFP